MNVKEILETHSEQVERKFREYNGLVTKETAAYIVAQEMGLELEEENTPELRITHLASGMRRVSISGKLLALTPIEEYTRKDGSQGHTQGLLLRDETGKVDVRLWELPNEELRVGSLLKIQRGYVKSRDGGLELNVSEKSSLELLGFEPLRLSELQHGAGGLTIRASVLRVNPDRVFQSKRGGVYRASSLTIHQDGTKARVIFWEDEAEKPITLRPSQDVEISNLEASFNDSGLLELRASPETEVTVKGSGAHSEVRTLSPCLVSRPELDVDLHGDIASITHESERITIMLTEENCQLRLAVVHQDLLNQLSKAADGKILMARGVDVNRVSAGGFEARSTIWSEFTIH